MVSRNMPQVKGPGRCLPDFSPCKGAGVCLRHLANTTDYSGAVTACEELGARLTLPRVEAHNECLRGIYADTFLWMGAVDPELNGIYYGIDGLGQAPNDSSWWGPGERDHAGATTNPEPNVIFVISYWADASAATAAQPVCETPALH
ncbi:CD209 antigen [Amphibalanus amphitrite]|uniref:CD209 antigen n=1 Tax=Amphibalanus amphitrite TaxID=1232801 RepID=A0A6A4W914_AMPAM|nr:CD209 antigen [Amphibalanus amphitrite]